MFLARHFFPAFDKFSADSSCSESAFPDTKRHKWPWVNIYTSQQILVGNGHRSYGWFSVSPVLNWSQHKGLPQQQIMQHITQEGIIYHTKRKLLLTKARRWEQLQCCSKAKPTRGSIPAAMRVATTCVAGMHEITVTQCLHEKSVRTWRNRCYVSDLPESIKIFWSNKKKLSLQ